MTISDYLNALVNQKNNLASNLNSRGVSASSEEKFNTLIPKVLEIEGSDEPTKPLDKKLYSFGLLSDVHLKDTSMGQDDNTNSVVKFEKALDYYKAESVDFVSIAGDILAANTRYPTTENPLSDVEIDLAERIWINEVLLYKNTIAKHDIPIHAVMGNHDVWALAYNEFKNVGSAYVLTTNDPEYSSFKGKSCEQVLNEEIGELNYVIEKENDVFVYFSMYFWKYSQFCRQQDLDWLSNVLETNKSKRVFLVAHMPLPGMFDGLSTRTGLSIVPGNEADQFRVLMETYSNVIHISGHLHYVLDYEGQEGFTNPNTHKISNGATVIKCSSCAYTRLVGDPYINDVNGSQGYIVDVYSDKVVFRGLDFSGDEVKNIDKAHYIVNL